ncbi:putative NAD(P)H nitroreductase [Spiroplasma syrphidicola EA-1]|uniref:Putative NAD(P)H nitroreductase n=1 Tax=Spiroplasma syrphidicola EA-1 TaxID=1276229 RepID=R4UHT3_9MOLU|nr:nitroreductase family protein [Spiroplasma syrphidicola]AGM25685.1 putative NAD(P)H nitroreductase [Spiroplasma syrphidicola EA-1]
MTFKELSEKRHTIKTYLPNNTISDEELQKILAAVYLAPSSNNLQDTNILVIRDQKLKEEIANDFEGFNTQNVKDASALFLFVGTPFKMQMLNNGQSIYDGTMKFLDIPEADRQKMKEGVLQYYGVMSDSTDLVHIINAAIKFSFTMLAATELGYGSTPMLGMQKCKLEKTLINKAMMKQGQQVILALSIGVPAPDDARNKAQANRIRLPFEETYKIY